LDASVAQWKSSAFVKRGPWVRIPPLAGVGGSEMGISQVSLTVDDTDIEKVVPINPFVSEITRNVITGVVPSLKGVEKANRITINIRR
jgi:hypothetical protein